MVSSHACSGCSEPLLACRCVCTGVAVGDLGAIDEAVGRGVHASDVIRSFKPTAVGFLVAHRCFPGPTLHAPCRA